MIDEPIIGGLLHRCRMPLGVVWRVALKSVLAADAKGDIYCHSIIGR